MKSRKLRRREKKSSVPSVIPKPAPTSEPARSAGSRRLWSLVSLGLVATAFLILGLWWGGIIRFGSENEQGGKNKELAHQPAESPEKPVSPKKKTGGSFLENFGNEEKEDEKAPQAIPSSGTLEKNFQALTELQDRIDELDKQVGEGRLDPEVLKKATLEKKQLVARFDKISAVLQKDLARARTARPKDPVPQWLAGELLRNVGGEPQEVLPYLEKAAAAGLDRPRFFITFAQVLFASNQFDRAYQVACKGLDSQPRDRAAWNAFGRSAMGLQKYEEILNRLELSFSQEKPSWTVAIKDQAIRLLPLWQEELKRRQAEARANDLPRVKLVIEHRRFVQRGGEARPRIERTGREEVIVELFEDQAPATVANFLDLVSRGFYNGTRFHLAQSGMAVAGGDPNSKNPDPAQDGKGGPGYVIPDEYFARGARKHWRGSLGMFNTGPHTAGSQFYLTLIPTPPINGRFTVFGRIIKGQESVDRITQGRSHPDVGDFGPIIPGDLLLKAEVLRKRDHEYKVIKEKS